MADADSPAVVLTERRAEIGVLTLNRPRVYNALDLELRTAMQRELERLDDDPEVGVVVLTGAGGNFCSGRDLKAAARGEPMYNDREEQLAAFTRRSIRKPVIAAVEGYALAGGFELTLSCDLVVAARTARFGLPEVRRNLVAVGGGLIRLPQRIPYHAAMLMATTGEHFSAEDLERWGVVGVLAEPDGALEAAVDLGGRVLAGGTLAVRATKQIIRRAFEWGSEDDAFDAQQAIAQPALDSPDRAEGLRAFAQRKAATAEDAAET